MCLDAHTTRTEDFLCRTQIEVHIAERELLLSVRFEYLLVLRTEVAVAHLSFAPFTIFLSRHHDGRTQIAASHLGADDITIQRVVILHFLLDVVGHAEISTTPLQVFFRDGLGTLDFPTGMQQ